MALSDLDQALFTEVSTKQLAGLIMAAQFLDIRALVETVCAELARRVSGKDEAGICAEMDHPAPITDAEYKRALREHPWLRDGAEITPKIAELVEAVDAEDAAAQKLQDERTGVCVEG